MRTLKLLVVYQEHIQRYFSIKESFFTLIYTFADTRFLFGNGRTGNTKNIRNLRSGKTSLY